MGIVGRLQLLPGSLVDGLRREGWCNEHDRGEQGSGTERDNGVAHDDLGPGRGDNAHAHTNLHARLARCNRDW